MPILHVALAMMLPLCGFVELLLKILLFQIHPILGRENGIESPLL